jgi:hypothetical protein
MSRSPANASVIAAAAIKDMSSCPAIDLEAVHASTRLNDRLDELPPGIGRQHCDQHRGTGSPTNSVEPI